MRSGWHDPEPPPQQPGQGRAGGGEPASNGTSPLPCAILNNKLSWQMGPSLSLRTAVCLKVGLTLEARQQSVQAVREGNNMQPVKGIALKLCSVLLFIVMASLIKAAAPHVPPGQAVFFRSLFAIPVIFTWLALRGDLSTGLKVQSRLSHFWRGLSGPPRWGWALQDSDCCRCPR